MNLESLRQRIAQQYIEIEAGGETWRIGKLMAADYLALLPLLADAATGAQDPANRAQYFVELLSRTLTDESGSQVFNSDEGRELLRQVDGATLLSVGTSALEFNTSEAKKN